MINIRKLETELWESADLLRAGSKLTSNQYCMPVLGLIFLRYAYSRFKLVEAEILKNHAYCPAKIRDLPLPNVSKREAIDHYPSLGGLHFADQDLNHCGFSTSGGTYHKYEFPILDLHCQPIEGMGPVGIFLYHIC